MTKIFVQTWARNASRFRPNLRSTIFHLPSPKYPPMRVLLAFDKFKGSLTAPEACAAAAAGLSAAHPDWKIETCPLADGGDGFAAILTHAAGGRLERRQVTGPRGAPIEAGFGRVPLASIPAPARERLALGSGLAEDTTVALVEMAAASGLALLSPDQRDPWQTSSVGTGELMRAAAEAGAGAIILGVGGSATHDLGLGALAALGLELRNNHDEKVYPPVPARWDEITQFGASPRPLPPVRIACDVTNPLLGPNGAATVFAPQKGLRPADRAQLEHGTARLALMLTARFRRPDGLIDQPGSGAAGGIAFGLMAALGAELVPGFALVANWLDLEAKMQAADLVITGEGRFDASSLAGKGPGSVVRHALALGKRVHVFAGMITTSEVPPAVACHALATTGTPEAEQLARAAVLLQQQVATVFAPV
jgi:glycerate kinase